jgi:acetyl esterase/lipase
MPDGPGSAGLVDPELRPLLDRWPLKELNCRCLSTVREVLTAAAAARPPIPGLEHVTEQRVDIATRNGGHEVPVFLYRCTPQKAPLPVYVNIHGGGYVLGSARDSAQRNKLIADQQGCLVVSPEYRLAPEASFPDALEDIYATLLWLTSNSNTLGIDATRIVIGGESAGGGLTAALTLLARDRGEVAIAGQILVYPMLDDRTGLETSLPHAGEFIWTRDMNQFGWSSYLREPPGSENLSSYAAAARATNLERLPPAYVFTGALDLFCYEDIDYARRLMVAGVQTGLRVYPGAFHAFDLVAGASVTQQFMRDHQDALTSLLRQPS